MKFAEILFVIFSVISTSFADEYVINNKKFSDNFWFGAATSAYQIEGGWNADGKGESYWDFFTHQTPSPVIDGSNADVACDSYHKYETDVAMLKYLGVTHYRFSLSWPRILPTGFRKSLNQDGIKYYKKLIRLLQYHDIIPVVTLYNWDIPRNIFDKDFMMNDSFPDWFADYARICYQNFGRYVQWWTTFNEPVWACQQFAEPEFNEYLCGHNLLKAHAAAWHVYNQEFRAAQGGKVSMVHAITWSGPASNSTADVQAANRKMEFDLGWWANPIYHGDYPSVMKERAKKRLPEFTKYEKDFIKGTSDYFCINTYSSQLVEDDSESQRPLISKIPSTHTSPTILTNLSNLTTPSTLTTPSVPTKDDEEGVTTFPHPNYPDGAWGLVPLAKWIQSHYNDPDILVTENGLGVDAADDTLEDDNRIAYIRNYLSAIRDAIDDGVKFFGYTLWSLMDCFEWNSGYSRKFGIYQVDFNSENRTRTPRKSVGWYKNLLQSRCLVKNCVE